MARKHATQFRRVVVTTGATTTAPGSAALARDAVDYDRIVTLRGYNSGVDLDAGAGERSGGSLWAPIELNGPCFALPAGQKLYLRGTLRLGTSAVSQHIGVIAWEDA